MHAHSDIFKFWCWICSSFHKPRYSNFATYGNQVQYPHQTLTNLSPEAVTNILNFKTLSHNYRTRNSDLKLLERPKAKTLTYSLKSIKYQSLLNWNQLLLHTKIDLQPLSAYMIKKKISELLQNWPLTYQKNESPMWSFYYETCIIFLSLVKICILLFRWNL